MGGEFLLFAGGEVDRGDDAREMVKKLPRFHAFFAYPAGAVAPEPARGPDGQPAWKFPPDVAGCVELALDLAKKMGIRVRVVDVNLPKADAGLVDRWVAPQNVLPMMVSPRGERLEGMDAFVPRTVRAFLSRESASTVVPTGQWRAAP